ncbi:MAG TPA: class I SAM-dependent methyltransferase [Thermoanaerobaculia bacterium]|nr:class I SAM-dependent methyltransferase [Thermoanaerobaculia bacterium]
METEAEAFLQAFHARHTGATAQVMRDGRTQDGLSSYELLAQSVQPSPAGEPVTVVDLACGDGYLLELLRDRGPRDARLIGIDMSAEELAAARQRLGPGEAELLLERAQRLPLPDNSVDYLLCHMALMLMDPVEEVVREIDRVLKPGGRFSAVLGGDSPEGSAYAAFSQVLREMVTRRQAPPLSLGDPRTLSASGLRTLFGPASGLAGRVEVDEMVLHLDGSPEQVRGFLRANYWSALLTSEEWEAVDREVALHLTGLSRGDGTVPFPFGLRRISYECR